MSKKVLILQENSYQYSTPSARQTRAVKHTMRIGRLQEKTPTKSTTQKFEEELFDFTRNVEFIKVA